MYSVIEFFDDYTDILAYVIGADMFYERLGKNFKYDVFIVNKVHNKIKGLKYKVEIKVYVKRHL